MFIDWKSRLNVFIILGVVIISATLNINTVTAGASEIVILEAKGEVEVKHHRHVSWDKVEGGMVLNPGDWLRTGPSSEIEIQFDAGTIHVYENTLIELPSQSEGRFVSDEAKGLENVLLQKGRSLFKIIKKKLSRRFQVITPSLIAGVKGTVFHVVEEEGLKGVAVSEGIVEVTNLNNLKESVEITANHYTLFKDDHLIHPTEFRTAPPFSFDEKHLNQFRISSHAIDGKRLPHAVEREAELKQDLAGYPEEMTEDPTLKTTDLDDHFLDESRESTEDLIDEMKELTSDIQDVRIQIKQDLENQISSMTPGMDLGQVKLR